MLKAIHRRGPKPHAILTYFTLASAAACGGTPAANSTETEAPSPSLSGAAKDIHALQNLHFKPVRCDATAQCPAGSHCDADTESCTWECYASSDCGSRGGCTDDGQCVESVARAAAPKLALAAAASSGGFGDVPCSYDDECATGAYCGPAGTCVARCDVADAGAEACHVGYVCNAGRCESKAGILGDGTLAAAAIELVPPVSGPGKVATVPVAVRPRPGFESTFSVAKVIATAPPGVEIACGGASPPPGGFASSCVLTGWAVVAGSIAGAQTLWVRFTGPAAAATASWTISLASSDIALASTSIVAQRPMWAGAGSSLDTGRFEGEVYIANADLGGGTAGGLAEQAIPVMAYRTSDGVLVLDPSHQLSVSGTLFYGKAYSDSWIAAKAGQSTGGLSSVVRPNSAGPLQASEGAITGSFFYRTSRPARFALRKVDELPTAGACASDTVLDPHVKVCVPKEYKWIAPAAGSNELRPQRFLDWLAAAKTATLPAIGRAGIDKTWVENTACRHAATTVTFGDTIEAVSGDLLCADGRHPSAFPLATIDSKNTIGRQDVYDKCLGELDVSYSSSLDQKTQIFGGSLAGPACFDYGRFAAIAAVSPAAYPELYLDNIRQWILLHAFLADEGRSAWQEAHLIGGDGNTASGTLPELYGLLERLERGWDVLLAKEVRDAISSIPIATHIAPDYRVKGHSPSASSIVPKDEQPLGISVSMLEGMTAYASVVETLLDTIGPEAYGWCTSTYGPEQQQLQELSDRYSGMLRYTTALEEQALLQVKGIDVHSPTVAWGGRYIGARETYLGTRRRVAEKMRRITACENPLGLPDESVPLVYDDPKETAPGDRFFQNSTFLLGQAVKAQGAAVAMLDQARSAWDASRKSRFGDTQNQTALSARVDAIKSSARADISAACGMGSDEVDRILDGKAELDASLCFKTPSCDMANPSSCYRGSLGEAAWSIQAASEDVELATQAAHDAREQYDSQKAYCLRLETDVDAEKGLEAKHVAEVEHLRDLETVFDSAAIFAKGVADCSNTVTTAVSGGATCIMGMASAYAEITAGIFKEKIENRESEHQAQLRDLENHRTVAACAHDAELRYIGIGSAQAQIQRRVIDQQGTFLHFRNLQDRTAERVMEARADIARELATALPNIAHSYWAEEKVAGFNYEMLRAKRLAYRAVEAMEYERQVSLPERGEIVATSLPGSADGQLKPIMDRLLDKTSKVWGNPPQNDTVVLSVRDEILSLTTYDPTTHELLDPTAGAMRLRARLEDPDAVFYDGKGIARGKALRFTLTSPTWEMRRAWSTPPAQGAPPPVAHPWNFPNADSTCAERVWSISASIAGFNLGDMSAPQVLLFKDRTFMSGWCPEQPGYQIGRYRPSDDIFGLETSGGGATEAESFHFQQSTLPTLLGAGRAELKATPAASTELTGQGLYGDYVLVIPWELWNSAHFDRTKIDDVLLRFELIKVGR